MDSIIVPRSGEILLPHKQGIVVVSAVHAQIDAPLTKTLVRLANAGEHIAVILADNRFAADEIARRALNQAHLKVARGETPHQVRHLVQRLSTSPGAYSVIVVIGLLAPFHDQQVQWKIAQHLLADTLHLLNQLARTVRVLVILTDTPKVTRPYLKAQVAKAGATYLELPALPAPQDSLQGRLF